MTELTVLGVPAPQGSKSAVVRGGRAVLIEGASTTGRRKHQAWREAVAWQARQAALEGGALDDDIPVSVYVCFILPKPKSRPKKARWADRKPDLDKLIRSTLDGLSDGGLVRHDSRVVKVAAEKRYQEPGQATGAFVTVREVEPAAIQVGAVAIRSEFGGTDVA